jgi:hypothetical protein
MPSSLVTRMRISGAQNAARAISHRERVGVRG